MPASSRASSTTVAIRLFRVAVTAAFLYGVFRFVHLRSVVATFERIDLWTGAAALVLASLQTVVISLRWRSALGKIGRELRVVRVVRIVTLGAVANNYLVNGIGGPVTRLILAKGEGVRVPVGLGSILLERLAILGVLLLAAAAFFPVSRGSFPQSVNLAVGLVVGGGLVALAALILLLSRHGLIGKLSRLRMLRRGARLMGVLDELHAVLTDRRRVVSVVAWTILSQLVLFGVFVALAISFEVPVGLAALASVFPLIALISALPISLGGWGVRELSVVAALDFYGVPHDMALALSIGVGVASFAGVILTGAASLIAPGRATSKAGGGNSSAADTLSTTPRG